MGVTFHSPGADHTISYGSFMVLRRRIAHLVDDELGDLYDLLFDNTAIAWQDPYYEMRVEEYAAKKHGELDDVIDFLYASDCEGSCPPDTCARIAGYMEPVLDDEGGRVYGYIAHSDAMTFADFYRMLVECAEYRVDFYWV